ncbi:uncharacterized protein [Henckelia pumila]|uniref:uncharacterized protein n=1 Tax=Henckelia pumila TaxID=405737 RepID=UPI003C6E1EFA
MAKRKALKLVQGSIEEQFRKIRMYCAELKRFDIGATVVLKLTEDDEGPRFQRLYVCFSACKQGFNSACRRIIGVDGCFLKVEHGGQLLSAVGLDPNNNIFPICYAMVERETKDNAEHRFCVRHLESNIKRDGFKSVAVKIAFWDAAKSTRIEEFQVHMAKLKDIDAKAYEWLSKKPGNKWSKAYFSTTPKSDILLNNMCESFNSFILDAREKPVIV